MRGKLKILHICQDEKFTDGAFYVFNKAFPGQNAFVVLKSPANPPLKYIKHIPNVEELVNNKDLIKNFKIIAEDADLIVLHGLNYPKPHLVKDFSHTKKILWLVMGAEIYQNPYIYPKELYGDLTVVLKNKLENKLSFMDLVKKVYRRIRYDMTRFGDKDKELQLMREVAPNIHYLASFQQEQFEMLYQKGLLAPDAVFQHFSFYPLEFIVPENQELNALGDNILLGNSASYTNNHLDAIEIISELNYGRKKIYIPLSYGNQNYAKEVIAYSKRKLGINAEPMINFVPLTEYNKILQSCGIVIMNHFRGQAAGNILASLYKGSKVYLSEDNLIYHYLKRVGCHIYSIEQDLSNRNPAVLMNLSQQQINENRQILKSQISEEVLVRELNIGIRNYLKNLTSGS